MVRLHQEEHRLLSESSPPIEQLCVVQSEPLRVEMTGSLSPLRLKQTEGFLCGGRTAPSVCPDTAPYLDMALPPPSPSNAARSTDAPSVSSRAIAAMISVSSHFHMCDVVSACRHVQQLQAEAQQL